MISITVTSDINEIDLDIPVQKSLVQSVNIVRNKAIEYAPYMTGNLRRSITADYKQIRNNLGIVGTNLEYAVVREYINKKNPHKKFYMKRALENSMNRIVAIFNKNLEDV